MRHRHAASGPTLTCRWTRTYDVSTGFTQPLGGRGGRTSHPKMWRGTVNRSGWERRYYLLGVAGLVVLGVATFGSSCLPSSQAPLNCGQVDTVKQVASGAISAFFTAAPDPNFSFQVNLSGKYYTGEETQSNYVNFTGL